MTVPASQDGTFSDATVDVSVRRWCYPAIISFFLSHDANAAVVCGGHVEAVLEFERLFEFRSDGLIVYRIQLLWTLLQIL